ncbi:unnamed protein product [Closterium sp. Naga37s-1]|nr:unnamed protein product [Closterium sp. Naga37s-1]
MGDRTGCGSGKHQRGGIGGSTGIEWKATNPVFTLPCFTRASVSAHYSSPSPAGVVIQAAPRVSAGSAAPSASPLPGRWVVKAVGSLRWVFNRCSPRELPPSEWIGALHERGIHEMSIVGDSHQRFLAAHLSFLLTAQADRGVKRWRDSLVFHARDSSSRMLRINFLWIDGIYKDGEFGCIHRSSTTNRLEAFPEISTTADVTLFEGGYWAASFCRQPLKALRVHLEKFALWALAAAPAKGRVIFQTIPSFPVAGDRWRGERRGREEEEVARGEAWAERGEESRD